MIPQSTSEPKLTIVPTPIGNLGDMTYRGVRALEEADVIYAEDTRMARKLISALGLNVKASISRLDQNTMQDHISDVAVAIEAGENVAYCSDAGMPGVSDPGLDLVAALREMSIPVEVLPGASACIVAYVSGATKNPHFYFGGFMPRKESQRRDLLQGLANLDAALIFYESPKRIAKALATIAKVFPERKVGVCRELTKLHEEVVIGRGCQIADEFDLRQAEGKIKGECAIVIDGPTDEEGDQREVRAKEDALAAVNEIMREEKGAKAIVARLMDEFGINKNAAYDIYLKGKESLDGSQVD